MKAIDTNFLVRILVRDDEIQAHRALAYVQQGEVFISQIVLCELVWVLEECYDINKEELISVLESVLKTDQFIIENSDTVWTALGVYRKYSLDFADCLIGVSARQNSCEVTGTFDKKAARCELFELV